MLGKDVSFPLSISLCSDVGYRGALRGNWEQMFLSVPQLIFLTHKPGKGMEAKRLKIGFQDQLSLNTGQKYCRMLRSEHSASGQKYCRMLQREHSAILLTFIKLSFVVEIFVLSIFEQPFYTGFTVHVLINLVLWTYEIQPFFYLLQPTEFCSLQVVNSCYESWM